jgi:hypothetical protein
MGKRFAQALPSSKGLSRVFWSMCELEGNYFPFLVCGTISFIFLLLWNYDIEMGGLCELGKVFYVCGKRFTKAPCLYLKKKSLVCVSFGNLYLFCF